MSSTTRQNSLLVTEDWKKIYQTFREADFQSYDFETLRKSMIDYLRLYYPEDFNDFIESSEYIALIDLIAFMGQSLAFRTDINARENFLDTAERRDSILKLARLVSYSPKRSVAASGLLKITSIATTETLTDSNGISLSNLVVSWNDSTNSNWLEQFSLVMNATLVNSQVIGKSGNSQVINGIRNDEYSVNILANSMPTFPFTTSIAGTSMTFEAVSATSVGQPYIYEVEPRPVGKFNVLYRNDNQGNASNNTGFFMYFKQGTLQSVDFALSESTANRVLNVGFNNINNSDLWLYDLNSSNVENNAWKSVPAVAGINVIYNKSVERNLYQVNTTAGDQVDLVFGDGSFANIPQGNFRIYLRTGNGLTYKITPDEMQNATVSMNYVSRTGKIETLTVRANLNYTVTNANANETIDDIRQKAPQQYYSQGRMITGEDYNIIPYTAFSDVLKVKAVNRTSSGVSRFLDVSDTSGKYSSTNIFAQDGHLYKEDAFGALTFTFLTTANVQQVVTDDLTNILTSRELLHFYYANMGLTPNVPPTSLWNLSSLSTNGSTGYFYETPGTPLQLGYVTSDQTLSHVRQGAIVRFKASAADDLLHCFDSQNQLVSRAMQYAGDKQYIYASVMQVVGDGTNGGAGNFANGQGPVTISPKVPNGAFVDKISPVFKNSLPAPLVSQIATNVLAYYSFALRYDLRTESWIIVPYANLNPVPTNSVFNLSSAGATGSNIDDSWLVYFKYSNNVGYTINWRGTNYLFESVLETKFYFDSKVKVYDSSTGTTIQDTIKVLKVNPNIDNPTPLGIDYTWNIYKNIVDIDGYENQNKVLVTFTDTNYDGVPDNPDMFTTLVNPSVTPERKYVFFQQVTGYDSFISFAPLVPQSQVNTSFSDKAHIELAMNQFLPGQLFFTSGTLSFYQLAVVSGANTIVDATGYIAKIGRSDLYFQYRHNSPGYRRIDPSPSNIIDLYMLTSTYSTDYQAWIKDTTKSVIQPLPPTTEQLKLDYGTLENYKAISDTVVFNSAKFKPLFGAKAPLSLQATFKVVKNSALTVSDNDVKSSVIAAINTFFDVTNWDFGESFFFSELSAYLHSALSPNVSSIIIVPVDPTAIFGSLYQINAEANEIVTSAATVDNVEIISAITAAQINANISGVNSSIATFGTN